MYTFSKREKDIQKEKKLFVVKSELLIRICYLKKIRNQKERK